MADVLSQSEVESLLAALDPNAAPNAAAPLQPQPAPAPVNIYDFKRPERVSNDQMRTLVAMHETFAREFAAVLSATVRTMVEVRLISAEQLTYSEFAFSLENPTSFFLMKAEPLGGQMLLDINPSIGFPLIDRLLGGGKAATQFVPRRPMTDIEFRVLSRVTDLIIGGLASAWASIADLKLKVQQTSTNPQLIQAVPPNEVVVVVSFELALGDTKGLLNLCIPYNTIEPLTSKLSSNTWTSYSKKPLDARETINLQTGLGAAAVELVVCLASTRLTAGEVAGLAVGDVIVTDCGCHKALEVSIEGRPKFEGYPGQCRGRKAVRIGRPIPTIEQFVEQRLARPEAAPS